jgi:hypothetical protein
MKTLSIQRPGLRPGLVMEPVLPKIVVLRRTQENVMGTPPRPKPKPPKPDEPRPGR